MKLFDSLVNALIRRAQKTPYFHIGTPEDRYMERYWLVPRRQVIGVPESDVGVGPVVPWRRPLGWLFQLCGLEVRLHRIMRSDRSDAYHDHPFHFLSLRLRGGYHESVLLERDNGLTYRETTRFCGPGTVSLRRCTDYHFLTLAPGTECWTIVICSSRRQAWGYRPRPMFATKVGRREFHQTGSKT